jgi:anti-sigma B factor antagonist
MTYQILRTIQLFRALSAMLLVLTLGCGRPESARTPASDAPAQEPSQPNGVIQANREDLGVPVEGYTRVKVSRTGDILVAKLVDRRLDESAGDLGDEFARLARDDKARKIVLDFGSVEFFSDTPFQKLMTLRKEADSKGKRLKLCDIRGQLREVFRITGFDRLFEIEPDVDTALKRLR